MYGHVTNGHTDVRSAWTKEFSQSPTIIPRMRDDRAVAVSVQSKGSTHGSKEGKEQDQRRHEIHGSNDERILTQKVEMEDHVGKVACCLARLYKSERNEERKVIRSKLLSLTRRSLTHVMEKEQEARSTKAQRRNAIQSMATRQWKDAP